MTDTAPVTIDIPVAVLRGACKAWEHVFDFEDPLIWESQDYLTLFFVKLRAALDAREQEGGEATE